MEQDMKSLRYLKFSRFERLGLIIILGSNGKKGNPSNTTG